MKKLKSLQILAVAGVAVTFMATGCSSTSTADSGAAERSAYRMSSAFGAVPITESRMLNKFPMEWGPVAYESYTMRVPVCNPTEATVASATSSTTTIATTTTDAPTTTVTTSTSAPGDTTVATVSSTPAETTVVTTESSPSAYNTNLQPGDTFVEAAGSDGSTVVKRVIRYTPFAGTSSFGK